MTQVSGQVTISPDFFRNERNNYGNWDFAFFRELMQNSVDANSSSINVTIETEPGCVVLPNGELNKGVYVRFADNGHGMSADVISNVYFRLGETTKFSGDTVGGYGKARILTCFSHHQYAIETKDCLAYGIGSAFSLESDRKWTKGCVVHVDVDTKNRWGEKTDMVDALRRYLSLAQLNCSVRCNVINNGEVWTNWLYKRRKFRDLSFGSAYVNKQGRRQGCLIVRVNGTPMFERMHRADAQVVVEIDPSRSREVLVSNRDSLSSEYEKELDSLLQEMSVNRKSVFDSFTPYVETVGSKTKTCVTVSKTNTHNSTINANKDDSVTARNANYSFLGTDLSDASNRESQNASLFVDDFEREREFAESVPSLILYCESDDAIMKKAMWLFNPDKNKNYGSVRKKLAMIWAVACDEAIKALLEYKNEASVSWIPGFLFSNTAQARYKKIDDSHALLLRPIGFDGKINFSINNRNDRTKILVSAVHEVTHMVCSYHDEYFCCVNDELTERVFARLPKIFKRMSTVCQAV